MAEHDFEFIVPPSIEKNKNAKEKFLLLMQEIKNNYNEFIELGVDKEDARYVLPNAAETKIMITMNARSLLNFFELRCCNRAQWEIRALADKMLKLVREKAPILFEKAGATCDTHRICNEGKMTCGKLEALLKLDEAKKNNG